MNEEVNIGGVSSYVSYVFVCWIWPRECVLNMSLVLDGENV
jgi:hypothetical protein